MSGTAISVMEPETVFIPAGRFLMGSHDDEGYDNERPQHITTIKEPFSMSKHAVSFAEYDAFCDATNRDMKKAEFGRGKQPVVNVSWYDADAYCDWLTAATGKDYRLPSEAQWEYACRAGTTTLWNAGETLGRDQANYDGKGTAEVGHYEPNAFGLHQMHGNVWEWCKDAWFNSYADAPTDGSARDSRTRDGVRALRGGSWIDNYRSCRSSYRYFSFPDSRGDFIGFRVITKTDIVDPCSKVIHMEVEIR